jgi:hypothetical protein
VHNDLAIPHGHCSVRWRSVESQAETPELRFISFEMILDWLSPGRRPPVADILLKTASGLNMQPQFRG